MLFTWDTNNLCIVFKQWHIRSTPGLLFSLIAVVLIGMGYEALRAGTRRYEVIMDRRLNSTPSESPCHSRSKVYLREKKGNGKRGGWMAAASPWS